MKNSTALQVNEDIKKNWEIVQLKLKENYGLDVYKSWIQNVEAKGIDFASLILIVKTRFVRDWIVSHYADKILDHYQKLDNTVSRIQFEINEIFDEKRSTNILDFGSGTKVIDLKDTNYVLMTETGCSFFGYICCLSQKPLPILYGKLLYKMGTYFLDIYLDYTQ